MITEILKKIHKQDSIRISVILSSFSLIYQSSYQGEVIQLSYTTDLQSNNVDLQNILNTVNALPEKIQLPELTNPAGAANIQTGYEAIDGNGDLITGTHEEPTAADFTSDATATAGDIASGKTAYVNGEKETGTLNKVEVISGVLPKGSFPTSTITISEIVGKENIIVQCAQTGANACISFQKINGVKKYLSYPYESTYFDYSNGVLTVSEQNELNHYEVIYTAW